MRKKCLTSCLLALFALLLLIPGTNSENSLHHTSVSNQPFVLLTATLDGQLVALNSANGKRLWSFKEDPVVRTPPTGLHDFTFVPSPVDGSIYVLQDDSAYELLYHSIPQLVHNSPCKSSGGVFYTGSKKGKWIGIDPQTGTRIEVYSSEDSEHRMCPASKTNATVFIGRTQYSLSMHQSTGHSPGQKGGRRWNITYIDYTADVLPSDFIYNYRHFISPKSGRVVTVDSSGENFWSVDFSSPVVAIYMLKDDLIYRLPNNKVGVVGEEILDGLIQIRSQRNHRLDSNEFDQFLRPENMQATLYVGETEHGLYALPVYVFANTLAGPHKSIGPLLLDGPELSTVQGTTACPSGSENQHPDLSRPSIVRGENLQGVTYKTVQGEYILLGYHDYPTSIKGIIFDRGTGGGLMPTNPLTTAVTRVRHDLAIEQQMEWTQRKNSPPPPTTNSQSLNSSESILLTTETDLGAFLQAFYSNHPRSFIGFLVVFIGLVLTVVWMCGRQSAVSASVSSAHASVSRELSRPNHIIGNNAFEADSIPPLPSGWIQAGQMQFDPKAELGRGCEGTIVLKGRSNARDCAVKKIASHLVNIKREIDALLKCDSHENVVRFYDYCNDGSCCYIALELCDHTILDYVKMPKVRDSLKITRTEILRQAVAGMIHLHDRIKIVHRDIKPQNVLLSVKNDVVKVKISDFGLCKELAIRGEYSKGTGLVGTEGWIAPEVYEANEPLTHATDVFAMGCLFGFVLTGEHPFGDACFKQQANIREQKWSLQPLEKNNDYIAINLIESMIRRNPKRRPTINAVDSHPFFWNESKRLQMILDVSDCIEKMDENRYIMRRLERGAADIVTDNWGNEICTLLQTDLRSFRSYNSASVTHLIRALRNKKNHYAELPRDLQKSLGSIPRGYLAYFTSRFPKLLIHVYLAMASTLHAKESVFGLYEFQAAQVFLDDPSDIQYEHDDIAASEDDGFTPVINRNNAKDKKVGRMGKQRAPLKKTPLNSLGPSPRKS